MQLKRIDTIHAQGHPLFVRLRPLLLPVLAAFAWMTALSPALMAAVHYHSGVGDASTAVPLDGNLMFVGDDETQFLRLYRRYQDGGPVWQQDFAANLGLTDRDGSGVVREVDIEASVRVGNRVYWLGSHSNCGGCSPPGELRPNRSRLFATDIVGSGTNATLHYVGRYNNLKRDLVAWDNTNGHRLGPKALQLAASTAAGVEPEATNRAGFNIEGLCISPDGSRAYLGFRAPLTPMSGRSNAMIIPLLNLPELVAGNPARGPARFGPPIELALGVRGIRSLDSNTNGVVIVAGETGSGGVFCIYTWTGRTNEPPRERFVSTSLPRPEGVIPEDAFSDGSLFQLISEGSSYFTSEQVKLGAAIPFIESIRWATPGQPQITVQCRYGAAYDVEASPDGVTWQTAGSFTGPFGGMATWLDPSPPYTTEFRFYRVSYPARP